MYVPKCIIDMAVEKKLDRWRVLFKDFTVFWMEVDMGLIQCYL